MRSSLTIFAILLLFIASIDIGEAATPIQTIINKVKNLLTPFLTNAQLTQVINQVFDMAWNQKSVEEIQKEIMPIALKLVNNKQKTQAMSTYTKMANELGGSQKAEALLNVLISKLTGVLNPYIIQLQTVIKNQRKNGKTAAKKQTLTKSNQMITKQNIQKAVNQVKAAFNQKQCDVAFKYLAGTYLKLGQYNFKATPCKGKGI